MSKRKSNPNEVIQEMNDLVTKDDKNNDSESLPDKDRAKLEDVLKEIQDMVDSEPPNPAKRPVLSRLIGETITNSTGGIEGQKVPMPRNRIKPLKENWEEISNMIVKELKLEVRFNTKTNHVEMRKSAQTVDSIALQRAVDFLRAFAMGFEIGDAKTLIRMDELFLESFNVNDVKQTLKGDHKSRAVARIAGTGGRNKHVIENFTKTRIVLADTKVHILGTFQNCRTARRAICAEIMGAPVNKIHGTLRQIAERMGDRY